ncbi:hypothetical protein [Flavobacterium capsici]|uniref:Uncharacterized protein n=1 Tax=Flavobacterium capsici TaxID=3075618 RepID=A0AA96F1H5_9FLAO|nr:MULTISPECIES: hypothetical protein [unclassified Flavobacterium]WNM19456.1 hypothetical protein RN608_01955 [Flavobacterium sp. PMR2A8]WNM20845.1 hypothetical protein RN605_09125 [Flavobacterium sp. PMTSA4]
MSKKKINIALLVIVLGLWGTVIYRYVRHFFFAPEIEVFQSTKNFSGKLTNSSKDTFELKPLERDPFLVLNYRNPNPIITHQRNSSTKVNIKKEPVSKVKRPFPKIIYYGHILSEEKKKETILLSVAGKFLKLSLNEQKENVKVISFNRDSIKVAFEKETQWIRLKK